MPLIKGKSSVAIPTSKGRATTELPDAEISVEDKNERPTTAAEIEDARGGEFAIGAEALTPDAVHACLASFLYGCF